MNRNALIRLVFVLGILLGPTWESVRAQTAGPTITITPINGVANTFELVRVYPDKVEVRREGIRLNFSRDSIRSVKNAEASQVLEEARGILAEVAQEELEKVSGLLERAERTAPRLAGVVEKFDWLIPEATQTLLETQQALYGLRDTARVSERLAMLDKGLQKMAAGTSTRSATWEQVVDQGLELAAAIPFPNIQKTFRDKFTQMRREIRLDLSERNTRSLERIRTLGEELLAQSEAGTLTESRAMLSLAELDRLLEGILDPKVKEELAGYVAEVKETAAGEVEKRKTAALLTEAAEAIRTLKTGLESGSIAPATGERVPDLERARSLLASAPVSASKDILLMDLSDLEVQVARSMAASLPRSPSGDDLGIGSGSVPPPPQGEETVDHSLLGKLKRSLGIGVGLGAGAVVALIALMALVGRVLRKKKAMASEPAPEFKTQYDIFQAEPESPSPRFNPSPVTSASSPQKPSPTTPSADELFGFVEVEPGPQPSLTPQPADSSAISDATADLIKEEDPFQLSFEPEEEEWTTPETAPTVSQTVDDPFAPTTQEMEEDLFGLGTLDESEPEPPAVSGFSAPSPSIPEPPVFDETLDDDPLGLKSMPQAAPPPAPRSIPDSPLKGPTQPAPSLDDDPFGFGEMLSEEDDLFTDQDSKE